MASPLIDILNLTSADIEIIVNVQYSCYSPDYHESKDVFLKIMQEFPEGAVGAFINGNLAGYIFFHPFSRDKIKPLSFLLNLKGDEDCMYLHDIAILRDYRSLGISELLLARFNAESEKHKMVVQTLVGVQNSVNFWKKNGFSVIHPVNDTSYTNGFYMKRDLLMGNQFN